MAGQFRMCGFGLFIFSCGLVCADWCLVWSSFGIFRDSRRSNMIQMSTLVAIILIAATTYLTRILGYVLLKNKTLTQRQRKILEVVPGCVLISVIAPYFVRDNPADLIALALTLFA